MVGASDENFSESGARWSLRLFGELHLEGPDGETLNLPGRRERVLLAYLAMAPDFKESRRNLIGLLWGDKADNTTLDNLRTCLWSLRKSLSDQDHQLVLSEREWIRLDSDLLEVDLWHFDDLVKQGEIADLEQAVAINSGELLEGLDLDSEKFAEWIRDERTRSSDLLLDALSRLMLRYEQSGDTEAALAVGQRILRADPFNEVTLRAIMGLYAALGRRNLAIQTYRNFSENLQIELGVEPEGETRDAFKSLAQPTDTTSRESDEAATLPMADPEGSPRSAPPTQRGAGPPLMAESPAAAQAPPVANAGVPPPITAFRVALWTLSGATTLAMVALIVTGIVFWRVPALAPALVSGWISYIKTELEGAPPSIAVLPFRGYGDQNADTYAAAISDGITSTLSKTSNMLVISRTSVARYERKPSTAPQIAKELGVRYLLEGSVTKFGDSVAVRVALIDTFEGEKTVPIGTYQKQTKDFFSLQGEITLKVVTALRVRLTEGEEERISQDHGTKNFRAWLLASEAQKYLRKHTLIDNMQARRNYLSAVAADPKYAGALTGLAWTYLIEARFGWGKDRASALKRAAELAQKSLSLDPNRAATFALLGTVALFTGRFDLARHMGERSVEIEYNDADSAALYALTLTYTGQPRKARVLIERAIRLRPYPPRWYNWLLARTYRLTGRPGRAVELLTSGNQGASKSIMPLVELAAAYGQMGAKIQGRMVAEKILRIYPEFSAKNWLIVPSYEDRDETERDLKALRETG
ncbi:MAG: BTAD domain-containing putative transcriptional regulator, partial [Alphaproteobacteria bacterium]